MKKLLMAVMIALAMGAGAAEMGKSTPKGFSDDFDASLKAAEKSGKNLWVLFTGSDWCYWCKKLEKEVISKPEFAAEGAKKFELVFLDFPNDKSLVRKELVKRNQELAKKHGVRGYPTILLIDSKGEKLIVAERPKEKENFSEYFDRQQKKAALGPEIAKFITPYEKEFKALTDEFNRKASVAFKGTDSKNVKQFNAAMAKLKEFAPEFKTKSEDLAKRFNAETIPAQLSAEKKELSYNMSRFAQEMQLIAEGKRDKKE